MNYGNKIAELRKSKNLTQSELGGKLNITAQAISKWENNLSEPDINSIKNMCEIFEISVDEFLGISAHKDVTTTKTEEPQEPVKIMLLHFYLLWHSVPLQRCSQFIIKYLFVHLTSVYLLIRHYIGLHMYSTKQGRHNSLWNLQLTV